MAVPVLIMYRLGRLAAVDVGEKAHVMPQNASHEPNMRENP